MKYIIIFIICFIIILLLCIIKMIKRNCKYYYFDNNATTTYIKPEIKTEIIEWIACGNPSCTLYKFGQEAGEQNFKARQIIADDLQVDPTEIYFTANATEANNIAIQSIINYYLNKDNEKYTIMCSNIEHPSVLEIFKHYINHPRLNVVFIPVDTNKQSDYYGSVNPYQLKDLISSQQYKTILISVMFANNETGAINPIKSIGELCKQNNVIFHCDATQAIGKFVIHPEELGVHALSFSGHKIHAPKGVGALYLKNEIILNNSKVNKCDIKTKDLHGVCYGGEQTIIRPGTENVAFNTALAMALTEIHESRKLKNDKLKEMKEYLFENLEKIGCEVINPKHSLPNTLLVIVNGINCCNKVFARYLATNYNVCVGTSSACQTSKINSHVVEAMKIPEKQREHIIRISMSDYNTMDECKYLIEAIRRSIQEYDK